MHGGAGSRRGGFQAGPFQAARSRRAPSGRLGLAVPVSLAAFPGMHLLSGLCA